MTGRRSSIAFLTALLVVGVSLPAWGYWNIASSATVTATAGTLPSPVGLRTEHLSAQSNDGDVRLTWDAPPPDAPVRADAAGYIVERQKVPPSVPATWSPLGIETSCVSGTCSAVDTTAKLNQTYRYRVTAGLYNWVSPPTNARQAASLRPLTATLTAQTAELNAVAVGADATLSGPQLIAVSKDGRALTCRASCGATENVQWASVDLGVGSTELLDVTYDQTGIAIAVGREGLVVRCSLRCAAPEAVWTRLSPIVPGSSASSVTADLRGVYLQGTYAAVVGDDGTFLYANDANAATPHWTRGSFSPAGLASGVQLNAVGGRSNRLVIVGPAGFIAGCSAGAGVTCGAVTTPLTRPTGFPSSVSLRDVAGLGSTYVAAGEDGALFTATSPLGPWADRSTSPINDDWYGVDVLGNPGTVTVVGASGHALTCRTACAGTAEETPFSSKDISTTQGLTSVAMRGGNAWAVGPSRQASEAATIQHLDSGGWASQAATIGGVPPAPLEVNDTQLYSVPTHPVLPPSCDPPSLRTEVTVPPAPDPATGPMVLRVRVVYRFAPPATNAAPDNAAAVTVSTDGRDWVDPVPLAANVSDMTLDTAAIESPLQPLTTLDQTLHVCVVGAGGGGAMRVDMIHADVES